MFNVSEIRADFPILSREVNGKPLVYLERIVEGIDQRLCGPKLKQVQLSLGNTRHVS